MGGLFPWPLSSVACTVADYTPVTLRIVCKSDNEIEIVDKTTFGRNVTEVSSHASIASLLLHLACIYSAPLYLSNPSSFPNSVAP